MKWLEYLVFRMICIFIGLIPFSWIYVLSDRFSFILQYIVRYRKSTIQKNIRNSFSEKEDDVIKWIVQSYYKNLCDVALESIKGYSLSVGQISQRYRCLNPEVAYQFFEKGQSIIFAISHYANWEWGTQVASSVFGYDIISIYKPLSNKYIDKYIREQRAARGMILCSISQSKYIFRSKESLPRAYFLIGDQSPSSKNHAYWLTFLNQKTACLYGIEKYACLFNFPVIYLDIQRVERGRYTIVLDLLCDNPKHTQEGDITKMYMHKLEDIIVNKPEDWLWSHRRWKREVPIDVQSDFQNQCLVL